VPVLWQFTFSHYNEKARWALDFKRVPHARHSLGPGRHIAPVRKITGQTSLPVLILNGEAIFDTTRIIAELERIWPEPEIYPGNPEGRERALELEDFFDAELGPYIRRWAFHLLLPYPDAIIAGFMGFVSPAERLIARAAFPLLRRRIKRSMNVYPAEAEVAREKTVAANRIVREVQPSGYLVGDGFTVADLTAAALMSPIVMPEEFPYPLTIPLPKPIAKAREQLSWHPAFRWVEEIYHRHRGTSAAITDPARV
jgi:glutathione S-transferase